MIICCVLYTTGDLPNKTLTTYWFADNWLLLESVLKLEEHNEIVSVSTRVLVVVVVIQSTTTTRPQKYGFLGVDLIGS